MLFDNLRICGGSSGYHVIDTFTREDGDVGDSATELGSKFWDGSDGAQVVDEAFVAGGGAGDWSQGFDLDWAPPVVTTFDVLQTSYPDVGMNRCEYVFADFLAFAIVGIDEDTNFYMRVVVTDGFNEIDTTSVFSPTPFSGTVQVTITETEITLTTSFGAISAVFADADPGPLPSITNVEDFHWAGSSVATPFILDNLDIVGGYAPADPQDQATGGTICEHFSGGVHSYTVSQPYAVASTRVYVDGTLQRINIDYTETDHTSGAIFFGTAPAPPATVTICFDANVG